MLAKEALREKIISNIVEIKVRGAKVIGVGYFWLNFIQKYGVSIGIPACVPSCSFIYFLDELYIFNINFACKEIGKIVVHIVQLDDIINAIKIQRNK